MNKKYQRIKNKLINEKIMLMNTKNISTRFLITLFSYLISIYNTKLPMKQSYLYLYTYFFILISNIFLLIMQTNVKQSRHIGAHHQIKRLCRMRLVP